MTEPFNALNICQELPKAELHLYLEGSLSDDFWSRYDPSVLESISRFRTSTERSLPRFLVCMENIHRSLTTAESYGEAFADLIDSLIRDKVAYAEVTWASGAILEVHKITPEHVYACIAKAIAERDAEIQTELIVDLNNPSC